MKSEASSLDVAAKGFVINLAIDCIQNKPFRPIDEEVAQEAEPSTGLTVQNVVDAWGNGAFIWVTESSNAHSIIVASNKLADKTSIIGLRCFRVMFFRNS